MTMASLLRNLGVRSLCLTNSHQLRCFATATNSTLKFSELQVELARGDALRPKPDPEKLLFGHQFSDHMLSIDWKEDEGWGAPRIHPVRNISLHPAAKVFHYAVEIFEGMKAYRCADNKVRMFRPDQNINRMYSSAIRSVLPTFDKEELLKCMKELVRIDQEWVPYHPTSTLYIRPTMIGTEPSLGVSKTNQAQLYVLTGPVGPYYPTGFKPVSLLADPQYVRAPKGGAGQYKMGSNYAPTIYIQIEALKKHNCQQVLWLYGENHQVTEVGTMNLFMFWTNEQGDEELVTPSLDSGLILPGVTRKSLVELASSWNQFKVTERDIYMADIVKGLKEGRVKELFGSGTACVVCPIEKIIYNGDALDIPTMSAGAPITMRLYDELSNIQAFPKVTSSN